MAGTFKPNELEMALKIAKKAVDQLLEQKPKGGLVVNKGQADEARMSYQEARLCIDRIERSFSRHGAFSFGICGSCTKWDTRGHISGAYMDCGTCKLSGKQTNRYDCCERHSKEGGGFGL